MFDFIIGIDPIGLCIQTSNYELLFNNAIGLCLVALAIFEPIAIYYTF